jgi:hypothetical protein
MTRIVDELHSACLAPGFTPIQSGSTASTESTASQLWFVNAYSGAAVISGAEEHEIVWNEKAGTLTDYTYKSTAGESPNFTFPKLEPANATPTGGVLLASNVAQATDSGGKAIPVFKYYRYATESSSSSSTPLGTLTAMAAPLTSTTAKEAASVLISFNAAPADGNTRPGRPIDLSAQVTFAFSAPNAEATITDSPCQ